MATCRFHVKLEPAPTSLWRDVVIGEHRPLEEFQRVLNDAVGLDQAHLLVFGTDQDSWQADVRDESPQEYGEAPDDGLFGQPPEEAVHDAAETTAQPTPTTAPTTSPPPPTAQPTPTPTETEQPSAGFGPALFIAALLAVVLLTVRHTR